YYQHLRRGDLNGLPEVFLARFLDGCKQSTEEFHTSSFELLLCVIEWVWSQDKNPPAISERFKVYDDISEMSEKATVKIHLKRKSTRKLISRILGHMDLSFICPHRLIFTMESIDVFANLNPFTRALSSQTNDLRNCPYGHESKMYGRSSTMTTL